MNKLLTGFLLTLMFLCTLAAQGLADCASDCVNSCDGKKGRAYEDCMVTCLQDCQKYDPPAVPDVPEPTPVPVEPEKD